MIIEAPELNPNTYAMVCVAAITCLFLAILFIVRTYKVRQHCKIQDQVEAYALESGRSAYEIVDQFAVNKSSYASEYEEAELIARDFLARILLRSLVRAINKRHGTQIELNIDMHQDSHVITFALPSLGRFLDRTEARTLIVRMPRGQLAATMHNHTMDAYLTKYNVNLHPELRVGQ